MTKYLTVKKFFDDPNYHQIDNIVAQPVDDCVQNFHWPKMKNKEEWKFLEEKKEPQYTMKVIFEIFVRN